MRASKLRKFIIFNTLACLFYVSNSHAQSCNEFLSSSAYPLNFRIYQEYRGGGAAYLLGDPFPLGTSSNDPERLAYEEQEQKEKIEKAERRRRLIRFDRVLRNSFLNDRKSWSEHEASLEEPAPYSYDDLMQRRIPIYHFYYDAPVELRKRYNKNTSESDSRQSSDELFLRDLDLGVDLATWNPKRFPKELPKSDVVESVVSKSTPRQRVLNPDLKLSVSYNLFEISKISPNKIVFSVNSKFIISRTKSFASQFNNYLNSEDLRVVEVNGVPMMAGKALEVSDGKPVWTKKFSLRARTWNAMHLFFPFSIGRTEDGEYRQLYPLFKPFSLLNEDVLPEDGGYRVMQKLELFNDAFSEDARTLRGLPVVDSSVGLKLQDQYLIGNFGPHRFGLPFIDFENLGFRTEKKYRTLSDEPLFKMTNILFAQLITTAKPNRRVFFIYSLVDGGKLRDWFEVIYWLHNPQIWIKKFPVGERLVPHGQFFTEEKAKVGASEWITQKSLNRHFGRHGGADEMDFGSTGEYLSAAIDFFKSDEKAQIMMQKDGSDRVVKYNFRTREFGVVNTSGQIITYYRLTESYRNTNEFHDYIGSDYWKRD
jgi:hypothetical protein